MQTAISSGETGVREAAGHPHARAPRPRRPPTMSTPANSPALARTRSATRPITSTSTGASTREFVRRLGVSPVTVSRALAVLVAEGIVITRPGEGSFVAQRPVRVDRQADDFAWQTLALGERRTSAGGVWCRWTSRRATRSRWRAGTRTRPLPVRAWRRPWPGPGGGRMPGSGRRWRASTGCGPGSRAAAGGQVDAADVIVTRRGAGGPDRRVPGAAARRERAARRVADLSGRARGGRVGRYPDRPGARGRRRDQARTRWPRRFAATGARAVYCQPTFQNPTGVVLSAERRPRSSPRPPRPGRSWSRTTTGAGSAHERPAPPPLITEDRDGRVVHLTSLTKPASPSLRDRRAHRPRPGRRATARGPGGRRLLRQPGRCRRPRWNSSARPRGRGTWRAWPGRWPPGGRRSRWPLRAAHPAVQRSRCCPGEA